MKNSKVVDKKVVSNKGKVKQSVRRNISKLNKSKKTKKIRFISIVDYTFLISLVLSVIFGIQTDGAFMWPFTIMLLITIICMMIILINAVYVKIFKKIKKAKSRRNENM